MVAAIVWVLLTQYVTNKWPPLENLVFPEGRFLLDTWGGKCSLSILHDAEGGLIVFPALRFCLIAFCRPVTSGREEYWEH